MKRLILGTFRLWNHRNYISLSIGDVRYKIINDAITGDFNPQLGELLKKYHARYVVVDGRLIFI
jgi:hypothetical protein